MIGTLLVLAHFLLRKIGLTCSDPPAGWPAYVCNTHEGGARTVTRTATATTTVVSGPLVEMGATGAAGMAQGSYTAVSAGVAVGPSVGAPSAVTVGGVATTTGKPSSIMVPGSMLAMPVPVEAVEAVKSPCVISIPNPPFPGDPPCPTKYYTEPKKAPFVIDNAAQGTGYVAATPTLAPGGAVTEDFYDATCIKVSPAGVVTPCAPKVKHTAVPSVAPTTHHHTGGGKSHLNKSSLKATDEPKKTTTSQK